MVRPALVTSVTCLPPSVPPVRFQISQESIVPKAISPRSAEPVRPVRAAQLLAQGRGAGVLPHDGVVHGFAGGAVPKDRRLPLVGDAERADLVGAQSGLGDRPGDHRLHLGPDLGGVVLHPARLGEDLAVFALVDGDDGAVLVEDDAAAGGGALVDCGDELVRHDDPFVVSFRGLLSEDRWKTVLRRLR
jgi:hypothetical protein